MAPPTELCTKTNDASPILLRWLGHAPLPAIQESYLATPPDTPPYQKTRDEYAAAVSCALDQLSTTNPRRAVDLLASLTETDEAMGWKKLFDWEELLLPHNHSLLSSHFTRSQQNSPPLSA